jgi:hypothetical protein
MFLQARSKDALISEFILYCSFKRLSPKQSSSAGFILRGYNELSLFNEFSGSNAYDIDHSVRKQR